MKTKYLFLLSSLFIINTLFAQKIVNGAEQMETLLPLLNNKRVALVVNQTSMTGNTHLLDTLLASNINIKKVFAPEHGFRGNADAGETVKNGKDISTGIPIQSLYGKTRNLLHNRCRILMWLCLIFKMWEHDSTLISAPCTT